MKKLFLMTILFGVFSLKSEQDIEKLSLGEKLSTLALGAVGGSISAGYFRVGAFYMNIVLAAEDACVRDMSRSGRVARTAARSVAGLTAGTCALCGVFRLGALLRECGLISAKRPEKN